MRGFPLYDLYWQEFEKLVILICERILGIGTFNFSTGSDQGSDGKFNGKAQNFPSQTGPWNGKFIIQAKHTKKLNAKCSDSEFKRILEGEVKSLKKLVALNQLDYYLLFTNRKLSGITDEKITDFIKSDLDIENRIIGDERIQLWLKEYPEIAEILGLNRLFIPLDFYEKDLKKILIKFSETLEEEDEINENQGEIKWIDKEKKNELNNLGEEYFEHMRKCSFSYFKKIDDFLKDVGNKTYKNFYKRTIIDLRGKIIIKRRQYSKFEEILDYLYDRVFKKNEDLEDKRELIHIFLHYMYFNCDIGRT